MSDAEVKALKKEIKKNIEAANEKTLRIIHQILQIEDEQDWWDDLPKEVQEAIDEGIEQANKGQVFSHETFLKRNKLWLKK